MRRPVLNARVATLAAALFVAAACETARDTAPPASPGLDAGVDAGEIGDGPAPGVSEADAPAMPEAVAEAPPVEMDAMEPLPASCSPQACPGHANGTAICRDDACDYQCRDSRFPHRCPGGCCQCEQDSDCAPLPDQVGSCNGGACSFKAMCDLGRRSWTMLAPIACRSSTWTFKRRDDGLWDAAEAGCGDATGIASYDGATVRLDFSYDGGSGRYTWPVDGRCFGGRGMLEFFTGPETGNVYDSTLIAN